MSYNSDEYFNSKNFKSILKDYETSLRTGEFILLDPEEMADIAEYYYNKGNIGQAHEILDKAIEIYPGAAPPLLFKARIALLDDQDTVKAGLIAEQIDDKSDIEYHYIKAEIMINDGETDKADSYLEMCLENIDEEDKDYCYIDITDIFLDYEKYDMAEKWFNRVKNRELIEYKEQYAKILFEKGDFEKSKILYDELIDKDPFSVKYWNSLASSQFLCNNIEDAIKSCEYAIAINPDNAIAILNKANGLYQLGNIEGALSCYEKYNKLNPNEINGEIMLGCCYVMLEKYEKAIEHFERIETLADAEAKDLSDTYKEWAFALSRLNRHQEALKVLDKTEPLNCDHNEILVLRGNILLESGDKEAAINFYTKALTSSGFSPDIILRVSISLYEYGFFKSSYKLLHTLISQDKNITKCYVYLAACCFDMQKYDEFLEHLEQAVKYTPEDVRNILGYLFPQNIQPADYVKYIKEKLS